VKEAIRAKKVAYKAWLNNKADSSLHSRFAEVRKFKMQSWENFGHKLDFNYWQANMVFWQKNGVSTENIHNC